MSLSLQSEELLEAVSLPPLILLGFTATVKQKKQFFPTHCSSYSAELNSNVFTHKKQTKQKLKDKPSSTAFGGVNVAMEPAGEVLDLGPQELVILH